MRSQLVFRNNSQNWYLEQTYKVETKRDLEKAESTYRQIEAIIAAKEAAIQNAQRHLENNDQKLLPSAIGYAKIYSKDMFLFQRIQLEFSRLIDTKFW